MFFIYDQGAIAYKFISQIESGLLINDEGRTKVSTEACDLDTPEKIELRDKGTLPLSFLEKPNMQAEWFDKIITITTADDRTHRLNKKQSIAFSKELKNATDFYESKFAEKIYIDKFGISYTQIIYVDFESDKCIVHSTANKEKKLYGDNMKCFKETLKAYASLTKGEHSGMSYELGGLSGSDGFNEPTPPSYILSENRFKL